MAELVVVMMVVVVVVVVVAVVVVSVKSKSDQLYLQTLITLHLEIFYCLLITV